MLYAEQGEWGSETWRIVRAHIVKRGIRYLFAVFVLGITFGIYLSYTSTTFGLKEKIQYFGFATAIWSILFNSIQFRAKYEWNKREVTILTAWKIKESIEPELSTLNKAFGYRDLPPTTTIPYKEIHEKICKKDEKGDYEKGDEGQLIIDYKNEEAVKIKKSIYQTLDTYEYVSAGVFEEIFDELIIYDLFGGMLIRGYNIFQNYIDHVNNDMYPDQGGLIWLNFKTLALRFKEKDGNLPKANFRAVKDK